MGNIRLRPLRRADDVAVWGVFQACTDYSALEKGRPPKPEDVDAFFSDRPPGVAEENAHKLGVYDRGKLIGLVDLIDGYPGEADWYVGLLMLVPDARGRGVGRTALEQIIARACEVGGARLLLCVLEENTRGQAFWARAGFMFLRRTDPVEIGKKLHVKIELARDL